MLVLRAPGLALAFCFLTIAASARAKPDSRVQTPLYVYLIDQTFPQVAGPAINGLDERRRGPIFGAALQQAAHEGKLPPVVISNKDLSLPSTVLSEPRIPAGQELARIYLTQWSQTRLGGIADTEILCRFFVEIIRDGHVTRKLGPFFARKTCDVVVISRPEDRWAQYQDVAVKALEEMAAVLATRTTN